MRPLTPQPLIPNTHKRHKKKERSKQVTTMTHHTHHMKYRVLRQNPLDERIFTLENERGKQFNVDFYTNGQFPPPEGADSTDESWREWLGTFVGKTLELERIEPYYYFSSGNQRIVD